MIWLKLPGSGHRVRATVSPEGNSYQVISPENVPVTVLHDWLNIAKGLPTMPEDLSDVEERPLASENRFTRDEMFLEMAATVAKRSTCLRGNVGALIVVDGHPVSMGYNGAPPGLPHCTEIGCEPAPIAFQVSDGNEVENILKHYGCQRTVHAEANSIAWAARAGVPTASATMYCTHSPCRKCAELIASAGISELHYKTEYRATPFELCEELGIYLVHHGAISAK